MRRSGCGRINAEALLEQASGRVHSPVDRFKTKGGVSGEDSPFSLISLVRKPVEGVCNS